MKVLSILVTFWSYGIEIPDNSMKCLEEKRSLGTGVVWLVFNNWAVFPL